MAIGGSKFGGGKFGGRLFGGVSYGGNKFGRSAEKSSKSADDVKGTKRSTGAGRTGEKGSDASSPSRSAKMDAKTTARGQDRFSSKSFPPKAPEQSARNTMQKGSPPARKPSPPMPSRKPSPPKTKAVAKSGGFDFRKAAGDYMAGGKSYSRGGMVKRAGRKG